MVDESYEPDLRPDSGSGGVRGLLLRWWCWRATGEAVRYVLDRQVVHVGVVCPGSAAD